MNLKRYLLRGGDAGEIEEHDAIEWFASLSSEYDDADPALWCRADDVARLEREYESMAAYIKVLESSARPRVSM